ncbi:ribonuclease Z [Paenibacillus sacheonensis]|uniref:Ribonuclease Z n=1 Tax=Paenibacillus sacheonensis TaxID=742054 RepID=A0A7X4YKH9_9BACL|nr:ribonuclease Z [Paenibacillus sacheonensis]NBC68078.1 ribonuclease Z [Paenibacillus sacheonensis]
MHLTFLGTSAGRPTRTRNVTSIALSLPEPQCAFWLFDAGEGTQHRMLGTKLKLNKLERIFITHMHGDHINGLPGLLSSRSYFEGAGPLAIYGPTGLSSYLNGIFELTGVHLNYELNVIEISAGEVVADDRYIVEAAELQHRMPCFGYRITERPQFGQLNLRRLAELNVPPGPWYGRLKRGEDVALQDGRTIRASDVVGDMQPGRVVTILGDTRPCGNAVLLAKQADLLVHEATFAGGLEEKAASYGHSTFAQAAETARDAGAKRMIVTHFSSRYDDEQVAELANGVKEIFAGIEPAVEMIDFHVSKPSRTSEG